MTLEPASISLRVEDVIVQKSPAWPVYAEHSFSTWIVPLLGKDAEDKPSVASCFGPVVSEQTVMTTEAMAGGDEKSAADHLEYLLTCGRGARRGGWKRFIPC